VSVPSFSTQATSLLTQAAYAAAVARSSYFDQSSIASPAQMPSAGGPAPVGSADWLPPNYMAVTAVMGMAVSGGNYPFDTGSGLTTRLSVPGVYPYTTGGIPGQQVYAGTGSISGDLQSNTGAPGIHPPPKLAFRGRVTGPVQGLFAIFDRWQINDQKAAILLGLQSTANLADLKAGTAGLGTRDLQDRARLIMNIYEGVHSLVRELDAERSWINGSMPGLGGRSLLEVMKQGSIVDLMTAKAFVDYANGR
jgi:hypothetical protein